MWFTVYIRQSYRYKYFFRHNDKLNLIPHPEGGHLKESYRDENISLIYYLLRKNEKSHWHRLTKNEILHFYQGDPLSPR